MNRARPTVVAAIAAVALLAACGSSGKNAAVNSSATPTFSGESALGRAAGSASTSPSPASGLTTVAGAAAKVTCPAGGVTVSGASQLRSALAAASPGTVIHLADGVYSGGFTATRSGTASQPIFLCGSRGAVLDGGSDTRYVFYLQHASWWRVIGFTVKDGQKGVVADGASHDAIAGLSVSQIGDEAIHLRSFSSDNLVVGNVVRDTGLKSKKFGEGIYVGSAKSNWAKYSGGNPDNSDRNSIIGNDIANTTSENIDIKEGTTGGIISGNHFSSAGMVDADSWVDLKGNSWTVTGNTGTGGGSLVDGIQTHVIVQGWGDGNVIRSNRLSISGSGYGINVNKKSSGTVIGCDNVVSGTGEGLSNQRCTGA